MGWRAISWAKANAELNGIRNTRFERDDCFSALAALREELAAEQATHGETRQQIDAAEKELDRRERIDVLCTNMQRVLRIAGPAARLAGVKAVVPRVGSQSPLGSKV